MAEKQKDVFIAEFKNIRLKIILRYLVLLLVILSPVLYFIIGNPLMLDATDAIMFKQYVFPRLPDYIFILIIIISVIIGLHLSKSSAIKTERKRVEMYAPLEYRKLYIEKDITIDKLKYQIDMLKNTNKELSKTNADLKLKLSIIYDQVRPTK